MVAVVLNIVQNVVRVDVSTDTDIDLHGFVSSQIDVI